MKNSNDKVFIVMLFSYIAMLVFTILACILNNEMLMFNSLLWGGIGFIATGMFKPNDKDNK